MRKKQLYGCVLGIFLTSACSGASVTQTIQPQVDITLEAAPAGSNEGAPTVVTAAVDNTVLTGVISTPNPCYTLEADISAEGSELTLTVTARSRPGVCVQMLGSFKYTARITGLASGDYPMRLVYEYPNTGWDRKEYEMRLSVR